MSKMLKSYNTLKGDYNLEVHTEDCMRIDTNDRDAISIPRTNIC